MGAWLWGTWLQVWPNLAASAIWAPAAFTAHHVLMKRHITREHEKTRKAV